MESNTTAGELVVMPNETLDEIEARWPETPSYDVCLVDYAKAYADIRTLIEMVQARDKAIRHAVACLEDYEADQDDREKVAELCMAALDTPPAQEPTGMSAIHVAYQFQATDVQGFGDCCIEGMPRPIQDIDDLLSIKRRLVAELKAEGKDNPTVVILYWQAFPMPRQPRSRSDDRAER